MFPADEHIRPGTPEILAASQSEPREPPTPVVANIATTAPPKAGGSLVELVRQSRRNGISWVMMILGAGTALVYGAGNFPGNPPDRQALLVAGAITFLAGMWCRWRADIGTAVGVASLAFGYLVAAVLDNRILPFILCPGCGSGVIAGGALITSFALEMTARAAKKSHFAGAAVGQGTPDSGPQVIDRPPPAKSDAIALGLPAPTLPSRPAAPPPASIDATIVERAPLSKWVILAGILFATALTFGYADEWQWAVVPAPFCFTVAVVFGFRWLFPRAYVLTDDALESIRPRRTIPYADILWVVAGDIEPHDRFSIYVMTADSTLRIGPSLSCDSQALLAVLQRRVPRRARDANLPASLKSFHEQQLRLHSRDRIHIFHALPNIPATAAVVVCLKLAAALGLAFPLWLGIGFSLPGGPSGEIYFAAAAWSVLVAGVLLLIAGLLYANRAGVARRFHGACLIVTPDGLAIQQRHLHGEMRWNEILGGRFRVPPKYGDESAIELDVGGTEIRIADAYDVPPQHIAKLIEAYSGLRLRR